jgi:hypothetical protein
MSKTVVHGMSSIKFPIFTGELSARQSVNPESEVRIPIVNQKHVDKVGDVAMLKHVAFLRTARAKTGRYIGYFNRRPRKGTAKVPRSDGSRVRTF